MPWPDAGASSAAKAPPQRIAPLLDLDPDLAALLEPRAAAAARVEVFVKVRRLPKGALPQALQSMSATRQHLGLLVIDGLLGREMLAHDVVSLELLGPGDVVRPWQELGDEALLRSDVRWSALAEARIAVLDPPATVRINRYPEIYAMLIERLTQRAQRLAVAQAICQLNRVDDRVLAMLWHLAGRWGRVTPSGTLLPLSISHRLLAQLVGARRPTVSTACTALARRGELIRRPDGTWLLAGEPIGAPSPRSGRFVPPRRRLIPPSSDEISADRRHAGSGTVA
jgi:CRP-like cAMP-binding protein